MTLKQDSVAVITGAGSGIGKALALRLARESIAGIAIADINADDLDAGRREIAAFDVPVSAHIVDVSQREQVFSFADEVIAEHGRVTHLINNAGVAVIGSFEQLSIENIEWLMGINFWGVVYGCKAFMPILSKADSAHIINVSSVFGMIAPPEQSAYCAAKFAVRGFTESLRHELAESNIAVSCVHPGGIKTNIVRNAKLGSDAPEDWKQQGEKFFDKVARTTPEKAAEVILDGILRKRERILIGSDAKAIGVLTRLFPVGYLGILEWFNGHKMSLRKK